MMKQPLELAAPPADYRPIPFWSWNEKLEPEVLREQIRQMHDAGIGGFFMHARGGLQTAYLSPEWMSCVEACIDEADKLGMNAWLYDENGWPSGFGGGAVNGLGVKYQQKYLRYEFLDAAEAGGRTNTIGWYTPEGRTDRQNPPRRCGRAGPALLLRGQSLLCGQPRSGGGGGVSPGHPRLLLPQSAETALPPSEGDLHRRAAVVAQRLPLVVRTGGGVLEGLPPRTSAGTADALPRHAGQRRDADSFLEPRRPPLQPELHAADPRMVR